MDAEFPCIARRDKKVFLSDQCKEIKENNKMGKTRDLFKKITDKKRTFHAKMGTIKDRNCMDLTQAKYIKRWQEYTEELHTKKNIFITQISDQSLRPRHSGMQNQVGLRKHLYKQSSLR